MRTAPGMRNGVYRRPNGTATFFFMAQLYVCGLDDVAACATRVRPQRLISLLAPTAQPPTPPGMGAANHLRVEIEDVDLPGAQGAPESRHIEALVRFVRASRAHESILIHCAMGISRSPAAALIALVLDAPGLEHRAAALLRTAGPHVVPNRLMIALADSLLGRRGRLVSAVASMAAPNPALGGDIVTLPRSIRGVASSDGTHAAGEGADASLIQSAERPADGHDRGDPAP